MSVKACKFLLRNFAKKIRIMLRTFDKFSKVTKNFGILLSSGKEFEASMFKSTYNNQTSSDLSITSSCMIIIEIESGIKKNLCFSSMKWIFLARNLNSRHIYFLIYYLVDTLCTYARTCLVPMYLYFKFFSS